ncbi:allantoinase PuuE [Futiania mangrovi]|uniref:Chitooligosaccharide deacetylase n=1 Tax=Futiania mangrovi TaxID=2959716 RepID=A0A9J6PFC0_9PROT|nr:allantoinase PuuE [Futiania mangrovii]MCP1337158.1 allantoinase PuuE [Futiania mangrovii]
MPPSKYPRDLVGYGATPPETEWPGGARLAVQFVVNYEEGGENCILHGDAASEGILTDMPGHPSLGAWEGRRNLMVESIYEYGSRVGLWRLLELFGSRGAPFTAFAVGMALERYPEAGRALAEAGHEVACHGYRWIDYSQVDEATERDHIRRAVKAIKDTTGERPLGWFAGRMSDHSRRLMMEEGGFLYDSDSYADDVPYWIVEQGKPLLIVPYSLDNNDMRFSNMNGFVTGREFFDYLKDAFDVLMEESRRTPRMMSIGLHPRLIGRPGRLAGLARFLDYALEHPDAWVCRRIDIARHWMETHPFSPKG